MPRLAVAALLLTVFASTATLASEGHHHKGKHGGVVADTSGHHHVELVAKGQSITLYVLHDDGELEDVTGAKGTATVLSGGQTEKINLAPDGDVLKGEGNATLGEGDAVVITLKMPGHKPEQARFKLD